MRCRYCMPEAEYVWLPRESILTFEEIDRLAGIFAELGVRKLRLTGGEPLLRHDLPALVAAARPARAHSTTSRSPPTASCSRATRRRFAPAGLRRVTVSLDTLRPERMVAFARSARHAEVLEGIAAASRRGSTSVKLNTVVIRGHNDDEILDLLEFARARRSRSASSSTWTSGGATRWDMGQVVSQQRDPRDHRRSRTAPVTALQRGRLGARRALPAARRHRLRRDRLHHGAVLPHLRPRPPDGRRHPAPLPVWRARSRSPRAAAHGRLRRRDRRPHRRDLGHPRPIAAPRSARRSPTAACCTRSRASAPIPGARCTRAAADGAARRAHPAPDPPEHGQHRPAVRGHRHAAPPHRAAGLLASTPREVKRAGLDYWDKVDLWVHPDWFAFRDAISRDRCLYFSANAENDYRDGAVSGPERAGVRQRDRGHADADPREASATAASAFRCPATCAASTSRTR